MRGKKGGEIKELLIRVQSAGVEKMLPGRGASENAIDAWGKGFRTMTVLWRRKGCSLLIREERRSLSQGGRLVSKTIGKAWTRKIHYDACASAV